MPPLADPVVAYRKLFGGGTAGGGERLLRRQSALDSIRGDLSDLRSRSSPQDRLRLDAQAEAVRTLELRLQTSLMQAACPTPSPPADALVDQADVPNRFLQLVRAQVDVAVAALSCDRTRVVTLMLGSSLGGLPCSWAPVERPENLHTLSHERYDDFVRAKQALFGEIAALTDRLAAMPAADGTLLDHTIVLCVTEIGAGHTFKRLPWMSIGGRALGIRTGQRLLVPDGTSPAELFAALGALMGASPQPFGPAWAASGGLAGWTG